MELKLKRTWPDANCTIGELFIDDSEGRECFILEPPVREVEGQPVTSWKVDGHTAIPRGRYRVIRDFSPKHGCVVPHILNIPDFDAVEIHSGNTAVDTKGCLLPGTVMVKDMVENSRVAFAALDAKIMAALESSEEVWITIG